MSMYEVLPAKVLSSTRLSASEAQMFIAGFLTSAANARHNGSYTPEETTLSNLRRINQALLGFHIPTTWSGQDVSELVLRKENKTRKQPPLTPDDAPTIRDLVSDSYVGDNSKSGLGQATPNGPKMPSEVEMITASGKNPRRENKKIRKKEDKAQREESRRRRKETGA